MPTQQQIQNTLLSASYQMSVLLTANLNKLKVGDNNVKWAPSRQYYRNIVALTYQYDTEQYNEPVTLTLYNCLNSLIGIDTTTNHIDPNYQAPNTTIVVEGGGTEPTIINKNQSSLVDADPPNGQWYLPFLDNYGNALPFGVVPVSVTVNGESFSFTYSNNFVPPRIYGFANNDTQVIVVTAI